MLVTMRDMLSDAKKRRYGVGMFNTFNIEMALGVLSAAEQMSSPVIMGTAEALLDCCDLELAADFIGFLARRSPVPVALHLDHGYSDDVVRRAIDLGFTSVMLDCSEAPYEENVRRLKDITDYAHARGASVEGELGHVVFDTASDTGYAYTSPDQARDFVEKTNVDALAVAIGTAHGVYKQKPVLDLDRLQKIRAATDVGLVLHGGSGLSDEDFRNVVRDGIQKINIYTDVSYATTRAARDYVNEHSPKCEEVSPAMREAAKNAAMAKLELFGCAGKA